MTHFSLFDLPPRFTIDMPALEAAYRRVQAEVHPDRHAHKPDADRRLAMEYATRVNEAYQVLKRPLLRARYLLSLAGVDTREETNTVMPVDFLMAQMELREAVSDARAARDVELLERLSADVRRDTDALTDCLARALDVDADHETAALLVRKLRFLEKLDEEIGDAIDALLF